MQYMSDQQQQESQYMSDLREIQKTYKPTEDEIIDDIAMSMGFPREDLRTNLIGQLDKLSDKKAL